MLCEACTPNRRWWPFHRAGCPKAWWGMDGAKRWPNYYYGKELYEDRGITLPESKDRSVRLGCWIASRFSRFHNK